MNNNGKLIIAAAAWGVGILAFSAFVLFPLFQGVRQDAKEFVSLRQEISKVSSLEQEIQEFQELRGVSAASFLKIQNLFINPETPIPFIEFLEGVAQQGGFVFKIVPGTPKETKGEPWPTMGFQISSVGSYPQVLVLLEKLESSPYVLEVENISISRSRGRAKEEEARAEVDFTLLLSAATAPLDEQEEES